MNSTHARIGKIRLKAKSRPMLSVVPFKRPVNDRVVAILMQAMADAESGMIDGIAFAATCRDRGVITAFEWEGQVYSLIGGIAELDWRVRSNLAAQPMDGDCA